MDVCRAVIVMLPARYFFFFFFREILFFAIRGDCPTFTLRQNRCVTSANGTDSGCEQQTGMLVENTQILKKEKSATVTSHPVH